MRLIKQLQTIIVALAIVTHCELILHDYGDGNKGAGVNDLVKGENNTWIGDENKINGNINTVIGDKNSIKGSNNIVQGSGNVVGDLSPQQMSKLQNQMFASFEERFKGMFNFNMPNPPAPKKQDKPDQEIKPSQVVKQVQNTKENNEETQQSKPIQIHQQATQVAQSAPAKAINNAEAKTIPVHQSSSQSLLIFRSYGKRVREMINQEIYNIQQKLAQAEQDILCKRWNYCLNTNRKEKWSFSSFYPTTDQD